MHGSVYYKYYVRADLQNESFVEQRSFTFLFSYFEMKPDETRFTSRAVIPCANEMPSHLSLD